MQATLHSLRAPLHAVVLRAIDRTLRSLVECLRQRSDARRRRRCALAAHDTLAALNDRQLHDLGFHRSELMSIADQGSDSHRARVLWS
jgi:uncharacterized protein YjiS (DUF1127 family)